MVAQKKNQLVAMPTRQLAQTGKPSNRLAALTQTEEWQRLPRAVQRNYEANGNRLAALVRAKEWHGEAVSAVRAESLTGIENSIGEWQEAIAKLGDAISDEEKEALILAKSNELAALLTSHQTGLDAANDVLEAAVENILTGPEHQWTARTLEDKLEDFWTFGEAELERRGYPPLSCGESWLNAVTLGAVADKRLREYERARFTPGAVTQPEVVEEGIIDVDFEPR